MSYDINFWKQEQPIDMTAEEVYGALHDETPVPGLAKLPVDDILAKLVEAFPGQDNIIEETFMEFDEGGLEFFWTEFYFRFDKRGDIPAAELNKIIDIFADLGCPMYDPQVDERYDADNGLSVGSPEDYHFSDPTPEQIEQMEKIKAEFMAQLDGKPQGKGCGSALLLLAAGVLTTLIAFVLTFSD